MPAHSKRYFSVKEAAKILGVSTNTIYSYLGKGALRSKRFGKGRFKIVASDLAPYFSGIGKGVESVSKKFSFLGFLGTDLGYEVKGNFVFWRIFIAYVMLSTGIIHFFWRQNFLISIPLTLASILTLYVAENWREHQILSKWTHLIDFLVLIFVSFVVFQQGYFYILLFLGAGAVVTGIQLWRGVNKLSEHGSLIEEYIFMVVVGTLLLGIFVLTVPNFLPFDFVSRFVMQNKLAIVLGIYLSVLPTAYVYYIARSSNFERRSHLEYLIFPIYGVASMFVAILYTNIAIWDMAFAAFFFSFLTFVVVWLRRAGTIDIYHKNGLLITFGWIGIAITLGGLSIYLVQARLKASAVQNISDKNDAVVNNINDFFNVSESTVISNVRSSDLAGILTSEDNKRASDFTKSLYNRLTNINRVLVYDSNAVAIGVYPKSSIVEGTNFSSRSYFQIAKTSARPYLSNVFESVVGTRTVLYAVPVYSGATFLGEVGVAYNLEALSDIFQSTSTTGEVFAYDRAQKYVLNLDDSKLGQDVPKEIVDNFDKGEFEANDAIFACETAGVPEWKVCKSVKIGDIVQVIYISNIVVVIFLFVNAVQSLRAGFSLSEKGKAHV